MLWGESELQRYETAMKKALPPGLLGTTAVVLRLASAEQSFMMMTDGKS